MYFVEIQYLLKTFISFMKQLNMKFYKVLDSSKRLWYNIIARKIGRTLQNVLYMINSPYI